jgi:hypothetical protein
MVKDLRAAGFNEEQAEAVTRVVRQARDVDLSALATKADFQAGLAMAKTDLQAGLAMAKTDLQAGLAMAKTDLQVGLAETKAEILNWMVSAIGIQTIVIIGAVLALLHSSGR